MQPKENVAVVASDIVPALVKAKAKDNIREETEPKKSEPAPRADAAEYKQRLDQAISEKGLTGRATTKISGNTLTLAGKLRPVEHGMLLKLVRDAPRDVLVVDHIEYDESTLNALLVSSEPEGADVFLNGAKQSGQTPLTVSLAPGQYNIVLRLSGISHMPEVCK